MPEISMPPPHMADVLIEARSKQTEIFGMPVFCIVYRHYEWMLNYCLERGDDEWTALDVVATQFRTLYSIYRDSPADDIPLTLVGIGAYFLIRLKAEYSGQEMKMRGAGGEPHDLKPPYTIEDVNLNIVIARILREIDFIEAKEEPEAQLYTLKAKNQYYAG